MWGYGLNLSGPGERQVAGTCECGNEHSDFIKGGEFLDQLRTGQLLKKDSAPWSEKLPKIFIGFHVKYPIFLSDFNETCIFCQIFEQYRNFKFHENPSSGSQVVPFGHWTDRNTEMTKLIVAFRNFANAHKNRQIPERKHSRVLAFRDMLYFVQ